MSEKNIIKAIMINKISDARAECVINCEQSFAVNFVVNAKRSRDVLKEFISHEDRVYLNKDALDKSFLDTIKVSAVIGEDEIELDANKSVADSWSESVKKVPLSDGQAFKVLVNGYSRESKEGVLISTREESTAVNFEVVNRLWAENKRLIEDKKKLNEDKDVLNQSVASLRGQIEELNAEAKKLRSRPTALSTFLYSIACLIFGVVAGVLVFAVVMDANPQILSNGNSETSASASGSSVSEDSKDGEIALLTENMAALTEENENLKQDYDELAGQYSELEKKYDDTVKEKDKKISDLESEKSVLEAKLKEYENAEPVPAPNGEGVQPESNEDQDGGESSGSGKELKVDASLIQDVDKGIEIISEDENSEKTIAYNAMNRYKDGVIVNLSGYFPANGFSFVVPEGYNTLYFDAGHIMDTGNMDAWISILVDNVEREGGKETIRYNESTKSFNVKGLKSNQIVTIILGCEKVTASVKYGITNLVLRQE